MKDRVPPLEDVWYLVLEQRTNGERTCAACPHRYGQFCPNTIFINEWRPSTHTVSRNAGSAKGTKTRIINRGGRAKVIIVDFALCEELTDNPEDEFVSIESVMIAADEKARSASEKLIEIDHRIKNPPKPKRTRKKVVT